MEKQFVNVIGAGLAGSEAAWQLANRGIQVRLYEMRPHKMTPAHTTKYFAELVCSNSLRASGMQNAVGVLKKELQLLNSLIIEAAYQAKVPAGGALAVDRELFGEYITNKIKNHPNITIFEEEIMNIPDTPTIIATGPLTSDALSNKIKQFLGEDYLYFFDAAAPIITADSIDMNVVYRKSRYDKGDADYLNCPMTEEQFLHFYNELIQAETVEVKDFELKVFEGCMPFEEMAKRGEKTLLFGPMKPVGLSQSSDQQIPYAVVQLRQDDTAATLYNIVGFQTHLKWPEQKRIIHLIPGLEKANIIRYGVMHRNLFINSPVVLEETYQTKQRKDLFFAGQMTGVEGYVESCASGLAAAMNMERYIRNQEKIIFPRNSIIGSMAYYISHANPEHFQPMNANFGLLEELNFKHRKKERKELYANRAIEELSDILEKLG